MRKMSREERGQMMLEEPVSRIIPRLAVPTIISMLITSIYNMADTYFVSQISTAASGAVGIIFAAMALIQAMAFTIGMGSGNNVARLLGAKKGEQAEIFASVGFFTAMGAGVVIAALGTIFVRPIVRFLGATETIEPHAMAYARYIFLAAPFIMCSFVMNNLLRFQGMTTYGMVGITSGGILNMALDPLFIFGLNMGASGAALATALSQMVSFALLLFMCNLRPDAISISPGRFKPTRKIYGAIIYTGMPSLGRQGIASLSSIILNKGAGIYGDAAIAAMSIVNRFAMFMNSAVVGFGQGFQPVCSFNFGAERYSRVKKAFWFCVKVTTAVLLIASVISFALSGHIIEQFRRDDMQVIRIGTFALRAQLVTIVLWGFITMSNMFSQAIGYGARATLISLARQGIFLIPALLILPRIMGLAGIQLAQPVADVLSMIFTLALVRGILKEMDQKAGPQTSQDA